MNTRNRARGLAAGLALATIGVQSYMERYVIVGPPLLAASGRDFEPWRGHHQGSGSARIDETGAAVRTENCETPDCSANLSLSLPVPSSTFVVVSGTFSASMPQGGEARFLVVPQRTDGPNWRTRHHLLHTHTDLPRTDVRMGFRVDRAATNYLIGPQVVGPNIELRQHAVRVEPAEATTTWRVASNALVATWGAAVAFGVYRLVPHLTRLRWWLAAGGAVLVAGLLTPLGKQPTWLENGAHLGLFTALALALRVARPSDARFPLAVDLVAFGVITELWQTFTDGRSASLGDVGFDAAGVLLGISLDAAWHRLRRDPPLGA